MITYQMITYVNICTYNVFGRFLILCHGDRQTINGLKIDQAMYELYVLFAKRVIAWESRER